MAAVAVSRIALGVEYKGARYRGYQRQVDGVPPIQESLERALSRVAGEGNVGVVDKVCGAEDFSYYQQAVPGFFFFIGCTPPDRDPMTAAPNHSPRFFLDEGCLKLGVRSLSTLALDWLA